MWLDSIYFTRFVHRLDCESILWTKQGRKQMYISNDIEFNNLGALPFRNVKLTGIKSCGRIIGFKVVYDGLLTEYYSLHDSSMTAAQITHFDSWIIATGGSLYFSHIGKRRIIS